MLRTFLLFNTDKRAKSEKFNEATLIEISDNMAQNNCNIVKRVFPTI